MTSVTPTDTRVPRLRVCAVSYLNTLPLVWGLVHGSQKDAFDLSFSVPSVCADRLESGDVDIGLVPCAELDRLQLAYLPEVGIACRGPVRSILLISKVPPAQIRTIAADSSSRSSVMLARIIVAERYGATPQLVSMPPDLGPMLERADAALVIGDPALRIDPASVPYQVLDLGAEWVEHTGLPMVFAVWAGRPEVVRPDVGNIFANSYRFGMENLDAVVEEGVRTRGWSSQFIHKYLTEHLNFELGAAEHQAIALFRGKVAELHERDRASAGLLVP